MGYIYIKLIIRKGEIMNCNECDTKNTKDANYCKNCGKRLTEEVNELQKMYKETKELVIGIIKKPIDTLKKYINMNNYQNSIIYIAFNVVIFSILMLVLVNVLNSTISYFYLDNLLVQNSFTYFRMFLLTIILYLLSYIVFGSIFYNNIDIKNVIAWLGTNSIFLSIIYLVLLFTIIISTKISLIILLISSILYIYNLFASSKFISKINENHIGYILTISIILTNILVIYVLPQLFI